MRHCAAVFALTVLTWTAGGADFKAARAGATPLPAGLAPLQSGLDYHSFANVEQFRVTRLELDLHVDSDFKTLNGTVGLQIKRLDPAATELILDTRDLNIMDVTEKAQGVLGATAKSETTWVSRPYHLERKDPILGQALVIDLPPSNRATQFIRIDYETSPTAPGLQWLTAKQAGPKHKAFFYTQAEPLGTRSWIPLQDTPQARVTYVATIRTFSDQLVLMSAKNDPKAKRSGTFSFAMSDAVPPYLIALAVGDFGFKETGPRTGVYAEKSMLKSAVKAFSGAESLIQAGEKTFGRYRWERYDVLVMPAAFPVGGMENPRLAFISPTVIAADSGPNPVMAATLAHAWAGNLVCNAAWRDLWLNDGLAEYLGSRMEAAVYGEHEDAIERAAGLAALRADIAGRPPAGQMLAADLRDRDPAEAFGNVTTEKGRLFFTFLESRFGRERFDAFLRGYFDHFAFTSISTEQFLEYLRANLLDRFPGVVTSGEATDWVTAPGLPKDAVLPPGDVFAAADAARAAWISGAAAARKLDTHDWTPAEWRYFLDGMPGNLRAAQLKELDQAFTLTRTPDAELAAGWFLLVIRNQYQPSYPRLEEYLQTIGRRSLIMPLYQELMKTPAGAVQAQRVFAMARPGYHPETVAAVDAVVNPSADDAENGDE